MMGDGKALQSATSHFLGQNFAQAFEVKYLDQNGNCSIAGRRRGGSPRASLAP